MKRIIEDIKETFEYARGPMIWIIIAIVFVLVLGMISASTKEKRANNLTNNEVVEWVSPDDAHY